MCLCLCLCLSVCLFIVFYRNAEESFITVFFLLKMLRSEATASFLLLAHIRNINMSYIPSACGVRMCVHTCMIINHAVAVCCVSKLL